MTSIADSLKTLLTIDGAAAVAVVDSKSGMILGKDGSGVDLDVAAAGNTEVVRAKLKTMKMLGIKGGIEDMLITLTTQYHVIRPIAEKEGLFIYLVLDKAKANLAMARYKVQEVEQQMVF